MLTTLLYRILETTEISNMLPYLAISFQFISQPFKIAVSSPNTRFLYSKDREICLKQKK